MAVDNKAGLLDKAEIYTWSASRRNNRIRLTGYAPSIAARLAILGVTRASFPGFEVVDRTALARGVPSPDIWMAGVSFGLKQLTSIKRGDVRMRDLDLAIAGEAEDVAGYRAVKQALANSVPKGIKVVSDQMTAPVVSPFRWTAQLHDSGFMLSGYVPNDAVRADLVAAAKESLPGAAVVDQMEPAEGAPPGWAEVAVASVRELAHLEGGAAGTKDAALRASNTVAHDNNQLLSTGQAVAFLQELVKEVSSVSDLIRAVSDLLPNETRSTLVEINNLTSRSCTKIADNFAHGGFVRRCQNSKSLLLPACFFCRERRVRKQESRVAVRIGWRGWGYFLIGYDNPFIGDNTVTRTQIRK